MNDPEYDLPRELHAPMIMEALERLEALGVDLENRPRSEEEILALTGATREQMLVARHRLHEELRARCPELDWKPLPPAPLPQTPQFQVLHAVAMYVLYHSGSAVKDEKGNFRATTEFRQFVVGLTAPGQPGEKMSFDELVDATGVPAEHLRQWLQNGRNREMRRRSRRRSR